MKRTETDQNHTLLFRLVTSYSSLLLFVLILGFFFMFSLRSTYRNSTYRQNTTLFENGVKDMDTSLRLFSTLTTQIGSNETIRALSYLTAEKKNYNFYALGRESMEYLSNLMSMQTMLPINSFYVYLPETEYFLSPSQFASKEMFYFQRTALDDELEKRRDALITSYENVMTLLPFTEYTNHTDLVYLYKIPLSATFSSSYHPGIACFELNLAALQEYFSEVLTSSSSLIYVTDKTGAFICSVGKGTSFSTGIESFSTDIEPLLMLADQTSSESGHEEFKHNGQNFTITRTISGYNGWNYYLIQPTAFLLNDLAAYQTTYLIAITLALIVSFLLIFSLSRANIKPYEQIHHRLENSNRENLILQKKNETLQDTLTKQHPLVYSAYVARIMKGAISEETDLQEISDFLKIKGLGDLHFHVLLISLRPERSDFQDHYQLQEYEDFLYQCFYHYFGNDILIYHPDVNRFALLLSDKIDTNQPDCIAGIRTTFAQLHQYLLEKHSLWTSGALGESNTLLPYFWKSYQQALEAAAAIKEDCFFQSYHELVRSKETYYYPYEMAQQLTTFITASNTVQIKEIFKLLYRENVTYRSISEQNLQWLLSDLRTTLIKIRQNLNGSAEPLPSDFDTVLTAETTLEGMQSLSLSLAACFKASGSGHQLIASIKEYLSQNYHDPDLSLKKISEVFSISESYFSYLFKAETGRNFSEYLEELRMQQAMYLLRETDTPLSALYAPLGYNNPNSFRRAFKKIYGASPKAFRQNRELPE